MGGGLGSSLSEELGRNVNLSTSENTFVWRAGVAGLNGLPDSVAFSFSLPLPVAEANTFRIGCVSFGTEGPAMLVGPALLLLEAEAWTVAGCNEGRVL